MKDEQRNRLDDREAERLLHGEADASGTAELRALSAVLRAAAARETVGAPAPTAGEEAALTAFRAARTTGDGARPHRTRVPLSPRQRMPYSLKAAVGAVAAALVFGGVAVAAQAGGFRLPFSGDREPGPDGTGASSSSPSSYVSPSAPASPSPATAPGGTPTAGGTTDAPGAEPSAPGRAEPPTAQSLPALCAAYRAGRETHGGGHAPAAPHRLVQEAGGEAAVADYCARLLDARGPGDSSDPSGAPGASDGRKPANPPGKKAR
ncbi:hypothetical protein [Streptomyces abikoensis]|uniref:hypothetical protein n=1 Tax=Streptomyces abikoensis TaxID=97398 RepID=UPI0036BB0CA1